MKVVSVEEARKKFKEQFKDHVTDGEFTLGYFDAS